MFRYGQLNREMDRLGFAESTCGTHYIRAAVEIAAGLDRAMMCKHIYPELAQRYKSTPAAIEHAIRTAIEKATRSPNWEFAWRDLGGWGRPTNSEVIMRLLRECSDCEPNF